MSEVVTVETRKALEASRRQHAAELVIAGLRAFARARGGRFLVFGSAAANRMGHRSDFDVVIDVPEAVEAEAVERIEALGREHGLPIDMHVARTTKAAFLAAIAARALVLA